MAKKAMQYREARRQYPVRCAIDVSVVAARAGYIRRFGLCRICFRELALQGKIPGVVKSSW